MFRQGVESFAHVSVREENAVKLISELGLEPPQLLLDPVFLLTPAEWLKIARRPSWFNEKYERGYILTYYLRNFPPPEIKSVAAELNLPVINLLDIKNFNHYTVAPEEFIYLFANASLIYANSFHGVAFSILFKRPFVNCEYDDESTRSMGTRIPSLLKMFGLENRTVYTEDFHKIKSPLEIDFSRRDEILLLERMKAFKFLSKALGVEMPAELNGGGYDAQ
ncbi:MAG: polysaccharide pyruvyl transferase family protein [Selenomonadaceae bacterium]|nr:polysaccharide pyruvyl transferase family protein [Selenomonadaceae bacterium]